MVPLTPYGSHSLAALPRRNEWVFSSTRALNMDEQNTRRRACDHAVNVTQRGVGFGAGRGDIRGTSPARRAARGGGLMF